MRPDRKINLEDLERMANQDKMGVREIARKLSVAPSSVTKALQRMRKAVSRQDTQAPTQRNMVLRASKKLTRKIDLLEEIAADHGKLAEGLSYVERRMGSADDQLRPILEARFLRWQESKGKIEDRYLEVVRVYLAIVAHEEFRRMVIQEIKSESVECAKRITRRIESLLSAQGLA
jgi:DNA-binding MarR family transcriptional regulator